MIFVFIAFMVIGISLVIEGVHSKEARTVNNGVILILIMLLSIIYSITTL